MSKSVVFSTSISQEEANMFDSLYPSCRSRYIRNAIKMANQDKAFFNKVFFSPDENELLSLLPDDTILREKLANFLKKHKGV